MLGIYRYILAMMVALSHLWSGLLWWQGFYGVFGFYVISGFLMTLILSETYVGLSNAWRYLLNRFLRIYPIYWTALALVLIAFLFDLNANIPRVFGIDATPHSASEYLANFTLLWDWKQPLAIAQSWSLRVELVFYVLMIFLVRNPVIVGIWLVTSIGFCIYQAQADLIFHTRYTSLMGSSVAFAAGAAIYHLNKKIRLAPVHFYIATLLFFSHLIFSWWIWSFARTGQGGALFTPDHFGLYGHIFLCAYLMWALADQELMKNMFPRIDTFGKKLGDISYAIFLTHWIPAYLITWYGVSFSNKWALVPATLIVTHILSFALFRLVERPINNTLRSRIRPPKQSA